jgi:hypothetical protein
MGGNYMARLGTYSQSYYDYSYEKPDICRSVQELKKSFGNAICGHCGKEYYRTYFVMCDDCLTIKGKSNRGEK